MVTRRDVLVTFLGTAAANVACRRPSPRAVPGALIDRVHQTGHLLRGPELPRANEDTARLDALIVGGGAAGLCAGWRLRGAGLDDFLLLEVDDVMGGTARAGHNEVSSFPWGAHYLPAPLTMRGLVPKLLGEMGVLTGVDGAGTPQFAEQCLVQEPEERLFYRGSWYEGLYLRAGATTDDLTQLGRFESLMADFATARDGQGRKAFAVPLEHGSDDAEWAQLDRLSMAQWLESQQLTSPRLKWLVDYACRDDYGARATEISAWAAIWYFAARQNGVDKNDGFLSWPEGNGRLIRHLAEEVGPRRLRRNVLVHTVSPVPESTDWFAHAFDTENKAPLRFRAKQLVLATPRFVTGRLVEPWRIEPPSWLKAFTYSPWVVANATVSSRPRSRGYPLCWDNVLYDSQSLGYVVATHQRERADEHGPTVLTWYYPLTGPDVAHERARLLATTFDDWQTLFLADLLPSHVGLDAQLRQLEVMRWGHAMIRPTPGFVWGPQRRAAQQSLGALHFAHSDLGALALFEEAQFHGVRAAEQVLAGLHMTSPTWL